MIGEQSTVLRSPSSPRARASSQRSRRPRALRAGSPRIGQRDEPAGAGAQHDVGRAEGLPQGVLPVIAAPWRVVADADGDPPHAVRHRRLLQLDGAAQRTPASLDGAARDLLPVRAGRHVDRPRLELPLRRLVPANPALPARLELLHGLAVAEDLALHHVKEADPYVDGPSPSSRHWACISDGSSGWSSAWPGG